MSEFIKVFTKHKDIIAGFTLIKAGNFSHTRESKYTGFSTYQNKLNLSISLDNKVNFNIFSPFQTHSNIVIKVDENNKNCGFYDKESAIEGDGCFTDLKNTILITTFADCVPILIYEENRKIIASVHSGWKGTKQRIIVEAINKILENGGKKEFMNFVIGPSIKKCCYEVGNEFLQYFSDYKDAFLEKNGKLYFDNSFVVEKQILECEINKSRIEKIEYCTCCNKNPEFWSYRRDKENFEGHAAFICLIE